MAQLTSQDRKDIANAAKTSNANSVHFTGTNRTVIDKTVYYGRSDAMKRLTGK